MKTIYLMLLVAAFLSAGICEAQTAEHKMKDGVYQEVDEMPEYPGGDEALRNDLIAKIKYPVEASKKGIEGKVYVSFVIDEQGKLSNAKIVKGVEPSLDKESLRVVNDLKTWKPGKDKGKVVKVAYTLPINYALANKPDKKE